MKITESRANDILHWLDDETGNHALLFEKMTLHRDAAALIRHLKAEVQDAWQAGLDAGREQGRGKDHPPPSAPVVDRALEYLRPHLEAGTFSAPDWAIQLASILTGGDGCGKPQPAAVDGEVEGLPRYGFPDGNEPRPVPCADGYWTPWHLAQQPAADPFEREYRAARAAGMGFEDAWHAAIKTEQQPAAVDDGAVFRLAVWMAKNEGHDDPHHLIWEGSPPEPWGEVWNRYEDDARAALTAALATQHQEPTT